MGLNDLRSNNRHVFWARLLPVVIASAFIFPGGCSDDETPVKPRSYSISGNVLVSWVERNFTADSLGTAVEDTVSGITLFLTDNAMTVLDSTVTVNGEYEFTRVARGWYRIAALKAPGVFQTTDPFPIDGPNASISKNVPLGPSGTVTAYPNPFDVSMVIVHDVSAQTHLVVNIHSIDGGLVRRIVDRIVRGGHYTWTWIGRDESNAQAPAGLYWAVLTTDYSTETVLIVKVDTAP